MRLLNHIYQSVSWTGLAASAFVTFLLAAYRIMWKVADNHLPHIQKACEDTAKGMQSLKEVFIAHATSEADHHEEVIRTLAELKNK